MSTANHGEAARERQLKVEPVGHNQQRRDLAEDREPTQPHQRVEPDAAARVMLKRRHPALMAARNRPS